MSFSFDIAPELEPFLGPWSIPPETDSSGTVVQTFLPLPKGRLRIHTRWLDEAGDPHQAELTVATDGSQTRLPREYTATGLVEDGVLRIQTFLEGKATRLEERRVEGDRMVVTQHGWLSEDEWGSLGSHELVRSQVKQVLVYRRDLKMRKGKIAAQCAHASVAVFTRHDAGPVDVLQVRMDGPMAWWTRRSMAKIVLSVETEDDLKAVYAEASRRGLPCAIIRDAGRTEFKGVPTLTTVAVGPAVLEEIDPITGKQGLVQTKLA